MTRTILFTGGTGTLGHVFTHYTLNQFRYNDVNIRIMSRDEFKQQRMRALFNSLPESHGFGGSERLTFILGDVRDKARVERALYNVDIVIHAAALKHVSVLESDPLEGKKTNVDGTINVLEAAMDAKVKTGVFISSDKACHPINTYGMTKALGERMWLGAKAYMGGRGGKFVAVRYGNVMGSRGSVLEVWKQQREKGERLTVTNPEMTRFLIRPLQAAQLIWEVLNNENLSNGELFVPELPTCNIAALLKTVKMVKRDGGYAFPLEWNRIGMQPGEKLDEELLTSEELASSYRIESKIDGLPFILGVRPERDNPVDTGYSSANTWRIQGDELKTLVDKAMQEEKDAGIG